MKRQILAAFAVLLVLVPAQQAVKADQAPYTIQDLGQTADGRAPTVTGLNAKGQLSGYVFMTDGSPRAVRFTDGFGWEYLPGLENSVAYGINASGDIVGYRINADGMYRAYRYSDGVGVSDIEPVDDALFTFGFAINDAGTVVGAAMLGDGSTFGFRAEPNSPAVQVRPYSQLCGVNNDGTVVGDGAAPPPGNSHAYRLDAAGNLTDIPSFVGPDSYSTGCAIGEDGRVGGQAWDGSANRAFAYTANGLVSLDPFASADSKTVAIAAGRSVGSYLLADFSSRAFMHTDDGGSVDLNTVIPAGSDWLLLSGKGVNAGGQIVGEAMRGTVMTTFRLSPATTTVKDTTPPVFTSLTATPSVIFPPKGQNVTVTVSGEATDDSGVMPVCRLTSVTGPGAAGVDFAVTGANTASVLAIGGRTYSMNVTCVDASDNAASQSVDVTVPPDTTAPVIASVSANPSRVWPPNGQLVPVTVTVVASDDVDDQPLCYLSGITGTGATADDAVINGTFSAQVRAVGGRTYVLTATCADRAGNSKTASVNVVVPPDTTAPVFTDLSVTPNAIWPPNGKMVPVQVTVSATDDVDANPSCSLTSISGSSADAVITGAFTANVRANKNNDDDRLYVLTVTCSDRAHNKASRTVTVTVTKNDPSQSYNSGNSGKGSSGKGK